MRCGRRAGGWRQAKPDDGDRLLSQLLAGGDPDTVWAAELDLCVHGHTHRWRDETVGRTRFVNVCTPTLGGERTMGILTLDAGAAVLERIAVQISR